ncbi:hypothetical protein [Janibacter sp. GS2]|uniref:hypothetical protein n=1 Tax=Janibacter sp. GS2 TaxID=3442646 RepID=UPI003EB87886
MRNRDIIAALAGLAMLVGLSACGGAEDSLDGLSGPEIMERVRTDMGEVSSLSISGEIEQGGATRGVDLALDEDGNDEWATTTNRWTSPSRTRTRSWISRARGAEPPAPVESG